MLKGKFIKRTDIMAFLNTNPGKETEKWGLVGNGMTSGSYSYEANETSETYIVNDNATTTVDGYTVSIDTEMKCIFGDGVYDNVVEETKFKAQKFKCSISISSYGGDGGVTPTIGFKINVNGDPENGTVTLAEGKPTFNVVEAVALNSKTKTPVLKVN